MSIRNLKNEVEGESYFDWLYSLVFSTNVYTLAMHQLYDTEFKPLVPNDENRAADGVYFRYHYERETGIALPRSEASRPCSMLEMLIGISDRFAKAVVPIGEDQDLAGAFNLIALKNLGLTKNHAANSAIIRRLQQRTYQPNGKGGLFPLKNPRRDQRDVEIWYQFQEYLNENNLG